MLTDNKEIGTHNLVDCLTKGELPYSLRELPYSEESLLESEATLFWSEVTSSLRVKET